MFINKNCTRENENVKSTGTLVELMQSSAANVKRERANQVINSVHTNFKQKIDACFNRIGEMKAKKAEMLLKLVPNTTIQTNFEVNEVDFVDKRVELLKSIENEQIWFVALKKDYEELFGKPYTEPESFL